MTMFEVRNLRVFFLSRHVSFERCLRYGYKRRIISYVKRCVVALKGLGIDSGTMAIAGLNPHSGEHGLFGLEEVDQIFPAVEQLKTEGYKIDGP